MSDSQIHPTAIVDPKARLGSGVSVGPYAVITAEVELGDGCRVGHHATIDGPSKIGPRNEFFPYAAIGFKTQDLKYRGESTYLEIGEGNVFREFCTVHRGTAPRRKRSSATATSSSPTRTSRTTASSATRPSSPTTPRLPATSRSATTPSSVASARCTSSAASARTRSSAAAPRSCRDVPPFLIADGNPAVLRGVNHVGLERRGFIDSDIKAPPPRLPHPRRQDPQLLPGHRKNRGQRRRPQRPRQRARAVPQDHRARRHPAGAAGGELNLRLIMSPKIHAWLLELDRQGGENPPNLTISPLWERLFTGSPIGSTFSKLS